MTGLIYLVIIALWAAVLIPMWLRRNDTSVEYRSAHTFNRAMRTLRRQRSHYAGYREPHATLQPRRERVAEVVVPKARKAQSPSPQSAARRRLIALVTLAGLSLLTVVLGIAGVLPAWLAIVPLLLLAAFVVMVRRAVAAQHRRTVSRRSGRQAPARSSRSAASRRSAELYDLADDVAPAAPASPAHAADADDDAWHAVPTTLPRYVTAPRATGIPRVIDLTHSEEWTSPAILREATTQRDRERADLRSRVVAFETRPEPVEFFDQYADEAVDRRAVND